MIIATIICSVKTPSGFTGLFQVDGESTLFQPWDLQLGYNPAKGDQVQVTMLPRKIVKYSN